MQFTKRNDWGPRTVKLRLALAAPLLVTGACTTPDALNSLAVGICQKQQGCHVRDQGPRHGSQQQRAVEDVIEGRQEPM